MYFSPFSFKNQGTLPVADIVKIIYFVSCSFCGSKLIICRWIKGKKWLWGVKVAASEYKSLQTGPK